MPLQLSGRLVNVDQKEIRDRQTGEVSKSSFAEILDTVPGRKSELHSVKIDITVHNQWIQAVGKQIICNVRMYAMGNNDKTGIMSGLVLLDPKSLPTVKA